MEIKIRTVANLATGEKVCVKSSPSTCWYPVATNLDLYLSTDPSGLYLVLNTQLDPIAFLPTGKGVKIQVSFVSSANNSFCIAVVHSGNLLACLYEVGSISTDDVEVAEKDLEIDVAGRVGQINSWNLEGGLDILVDCLREVGICCVSGGEGIEEKRGEELWLGEEMTGGE